MGPTASGKTGLSLKLANYLPIEIISVDSALIYKYMDVGTAKPTIAEQNQVKHYLIDILSPLETYSVFEFLQNVKEIIYDINNRDKIPILVGGTMMYYNAILQGISRLPAMDSSIRLELEEKISKFGIEYLYSKLEKIDLKSAQKININDKQRIIRALEVYYISGVALSKLQQDTWYNPLQDICFFNLSLIPKREILHQRINDRLDKMLLNGFIQEVKDLKIQYPELTKDSTSMRCVGYHEIWQYLDGFYSYDELVFKAKASTRQLAKRQITWLNSIHNYNLLENNDNAEINSKVIKLTLDLINGWMK